MKLAFFVAGWSFLLLFGDAIVRDDSFSWHYIWYLVPIAFLLGLFETKIIPTIKTIPILWAISSSLFILRYVLELDAKGAANTSIYRNDFQISFGVLLLGFGGMVLSYFVGALVRNFLVSATPNNQT